jgi:hypothetical protein
MGEKKRSGRTLSELSQDFLRRNKAWRSPSLILAFLLFPLVIALVGFAWLWAIPKEWAWGFDPLSWVAIPASVAIFFTATMPLVLFVPAAEAVKVVLAAFLEEQDAEIAEAMGKVRDAERKVDPNPDEVDPAGLMPIIRYSRAQLEAYYTIGLTQTRNSFLNSVIAMWIGFLIIILGIAQYVVPFEQFGLRSPGSDFNVLVLTGGVIIEMISALFLWVYRSSINQLTYFYDRQMHIHNVLFCFRIAATMEKPDEKEVNC